MERHTAAISPQLSGLLKRGYRPLPLRELLACHRELRKVPPKTFAVTFDDGYENVYRNAFPILCEYRIPATIFLSTGYLDSRQAFPFDDWASRVRRRFPPNPGDDYDCSV